MFAYCFRSVGKWPMTKSKTNPVVVLLNAGLSLQQKWCSRQESAAVAAWHKSKKGNKKEEKFLQCETGYRYPRLEKVIVLLILKIASNRMKEAKEAPRKVVIL